MKKLFLFLLVVAALVSGCVAASSLNREEGITGSFAYVTGKFTGYEPLYFRINDGSNWPPSDGTFSINRTNDYTVQKVIPGVYVVNSVTLSSDSRLSGNAPLLAIRLDAGKVTYLGDISISTKAEGKPSLSFGSAPPGMAGSSSVPSGSSQRVSISWDVQNNSATVKNTIKRNYPGLAGNLDAIFVYRPVQ